MSIQLTVKNLLRNTLQNLTRNIVYEVEFGGVKIKRKGGLGFLAKKSHNYAEKNLLASLDLKGKTIYDVGGYIGELSIFFSKVSGSTGTVIVFEPNQQNYNKIQEHIQLNQVSNVRILKIGVGNAREERTLFVRKGSSATGSMEEKLQSQIALENNFEQLQVDVDTLDNIISSENLPNPDFIKIDIEGMEYNALVGMNQTVECCSPSFYVEIHGADDASKRENIHKIVELFQ